MGITQDKLDAAVSAARQIIDSAAGRELTATESKRAQTLITEAQGYKSKLDASAESRATYDLLASLGTDNSGPSGKNYLALSGASGRIFAAEVAAKMRTATAYGKALLPSGTVTTAIPMLGNSPLALGKVPTGFLDVLPTVQHESSRYSYLRQNTRTNNAAPVAPGGLKPTSVYGLERVEAALTVIAHLSEPIDKFWLDDTASLEMFVSDEMIYGLGVAVENQILNGTGIDPSFLGILATSGVQVQSAGTTALQTIRAAITKLENVGHTGDILVLNASDWEAIETETDLDGRFLLETGPVDRAKRRVWGAQVVLSSAVAPKAALLLDANAIAVDTDRGGIKLEWSANMADDFARNQLRARVEGRFGVSVYQPMGVVKIALP